MRFTQHRATGHPGLATRPGGAQPNRAYPKTTCAVVFAAGGVAAMTFGIVAKILTPAANAVASVKNKVAPGA
jgi:hypothetical protein